VIGIELTGPPSPLPASAASPDAPSVAFASEVDGPSFVTASCEPPSTGELADDEELQPVTVEASAASAERERAEKRLEEKRLWTRCMR
jgi:hypothetical protein